MLREYEWDFDINTDANGDGITSNDIESIEAEPEHFFPTLGEYEVGLKVTDRNGNICKEFCSNRSNLFLVTAIDVGVQQAHG